MKGIGEVVIFKQDAKDYIITNIFPAPMEMNDEGRIVQGGPELIQYEIQRADSNGKPIPGYTKIVCKESELL
jgi:hypothetical protein